MKHVTLIMVLLVVTLASCTSQEIASSQDDYSDVSNLRQANMKIEGMDCVSCAQGVAYQFKQVGGVLDAEVSYTQGTATVIYDGDVANAEKIAEASDVYPAVVVSDETI